MTGGRSLSEGRVSLAGVVFAVVPAFAQGVGTGSGQDTDSDSDACPKRESRVEVPKAEVFDADCLRHLTTAGTENTGHTDEPDWRGLDASGTENPRTTTIRSGPRGSRRPSGRYSSPGGSGSP